MAFPPDWNCSELLVNTPLTALFDFPTVTPFASTVTPVVINWAVEFAAFAVFCACVIDIYRFEAVCDTDDCVAKFPAAINALTSA